MTVRQKNNVHKRKKSSFLAFTNMRVQHKQSSTKEAVTLSCCVCTSDSLGVAISLPQGNAGRHELHFTATRGSEGGGCKNVK